MLMEALKDKDWSVRRNAAVALGKIGDPSAVPALIEALGHHDEYFRYNSASAIVELIKKCKTIEDYERIENEIDKGCTALRRKKEDADRLIYAQIRVAELTREIAEKKDKLAPKRDLLLDDKPRPPKKGGGMYQEFRKNSPRRLMRT